MTIRSFSILAGVTVLIGCSSCNIFSKKVKKEAVLPSDREVIASKPALKSFTPEELNQGMVKGDWAIETVNRQKAVGESVPFLKFEPATKQVFGNNGCNAISGNYTYNAADSTMRFENMLTTMMLCETAGITDAEITDALNKTVNYSWDHSGSEYYLYFYDAEGNQLMSLMHQNFEFLNGVWMVTGLEGKPVSDPDLKLVIDIDEGKIHGDTGCNVLNGAIDIDMEQPNSISFHSVAVTLRMCAEANYETTFLVALEEASAARPISEKEVAFFNSEGKEVMRLTRTTEISQN